MKIELSKVQHERSVKDFPEIDLESDEYVVLNIRRSRIGIAVIWGVVALLVLTLSLIMIFFANSENAMNSVFSANSAAMRYLRLGVFALYAMFIFGGFIAKNIYDSNRIYVTNRRIIQKTRISVFANSTNIIELRRIEDVSFRQNTLADHIFHIGVLRMSTVGDETTYTLKHVDTPHDEVKMISHLVYECKKKPEEQSSQAK